MIAITLHRRAPLQGAVISEGDGVLIQTQKKIVTTTRKLMTAAFAVASVATLSLAAGSEAQARGGHSGGGGMRASFSGKFSGGHSMVQRSQGNRFHFQRFHRFGYAYNTCWKVTPAGLVNICPVLPY